MKIVIATGGTGGHIIPALKTAQALKQQGHDVLLMGTFGSWDERVARTGLPVKELSAKGLTFSSFTKLYESIVAMIKAMRHASISLKKFDPDVVAGFGGYGAFPVVMSGRMARYPTLIHEQNVIPGRANKLLGKFVDRIAVSFPESQKHFAAGKTVWTGCPGNFDGQPGDKKQILNKFNLADYRTTILISGGSQGSHRINRVATEVMKELSRERPIQVVHISGVTDYDFVKSAYRDLPMPSQVFDFCEDMPLILKITDAAIARAGALTVTEMALAGISTIFIPYPYAGAHQRENALSLVSRGAAKMIEEQDLNAETLKLILIKTIEEDRAQLKERLESVVVRDAAERLAKEITELKKQ